MATLTDPESLRMSPSVPVREGGANTGVPAAIPDSMHTHHLLAELTR